MTDDRPKDWAPVKPMEQIARERSGGRAAPSPRETATVYIERTTKDPRRENIPNPPAPEKSIKAKVAEMKQQWDKQKDRDRGR